MALNFSLVIAEANALEESGDLQSALAKWYLLEGMHGITSTSKDGLTVSYSETMIGNKIKQLERRIYSAAGHGQLRRVPIQHQRPSTGDAVYDSDGYQWA